MDPYNKDLHPHIKDYVQELRTNDLSSLEEVHGDSRHFTVDERLGVELRFDLGSLDAQVLLDTHGRRENHWDFVRQEPGRFQVSSQENTSLLMHDKQDDLKPFENCEGWPSSTNQVDTQLFIDAQEDVNMIADAFDGKDKSMAGDDKRMTISSYKHQEEASQSNVETRNEFDENAHMADGPSKGMDASEVVEASQSPVETPDKCTSNARSLVEFCSSENQVREELQCELMGEASPVEEQTTGVKPAPSIDEADCQGLQNAHEEAGILQGLPLECNKEPQVSLEELKASDDDVVGSSEQTSRQVDSASEHVDTQASLICDSQDSPRMEEGSKKCYLEAKTNSENSHEKLEAEKQRPLSTDHGDSGDKGFRKTIQESQEKDTGSINPMAGMIQGHQNAPDPLYVDHEQGSRDVVDFGSEDVATSTASPNATPMQENDRKMSLNNHLEETCYEDAAGAASSAAAEPQDEPRTGCDAETYKKDAAGTVRSATLDLQEKSAMVSEVEACKEDAAGTAGCKVVELNDAAQMVGGSSAGEPYNVSGKANEAEEKTQELNGPGAATEKSGDIEQVAAEQEVAAPDLPDVEQIPCSTPLPLSVQSAEYLCRDGGEEKNTSTHVVLSDTGLTTIRLEPFLGEGISQDDTSQPSAGESDRLKTSDCSKEHQKVTDDDILAGLGQKDDVLAAKASILQDVVLHNRVEAGGNDERSRHGTPKDTTEGSAVSTQELSEMHNHDHGMVEYSVSSTKPGLAVQMAEGALPDGGAFTEMSQPDGGLHVLLNVQKDVASSDLVLETSSAQDQLNRLEVADPPVINFGDTVTSAVIQDATRFSVTNSSSPTIMAAISGSQEPPQTEMPPDTAQQDKVSKRKADASMRNNRLKDSARASPLQTRSNEEQKSGGNQGAGGRKTPAKIGAQSKHNEPSEDYPSPRKSVSKSRSSRKGKKDISSPMAQEAMASHVVQEGIHSSSNTSKSMYSVNARQASLPDLNVSEMTMPMLLPSSQPFSEPQQVQLRAQILVYGALIQGATPEEALMVAAFSNVTGGKQMEASGRAAWEKQWQAAVERTQSKSSVLRDPSRASGVLVPNLPAASAKTSEEGVSSLHGRLSEGQITKGLSSHSRQDGDSGAGILTGKSNQSTPVMLPPVSSISTIPRSIPSLPGDNLMQNSKPRADLQQTTPRVYLPAPPQGPFLSGAPQWLSPPPFSGPWISQTQGSLYSVPSALFNHPQAIVNVHQTSEKGTARRNASSPSVPVVPTLFTPGAGSLSITAPNSAADMVQNREPMLESRPRKRKKTQSDTHGSPVVTAYTGNQTTSYPTLPIVSSVQASLSMLSQANMPTITPAESLALVVATSQAPKTVPETSLIALHAEKVSASIPTAIPNARVSQPTSNTGLEASNSVQRSARQLEQAQASAEEAAFVATSAVRESEALWSQLRTQKSAGLTSDLEMQLVSSAVAMTTAVSVAKAAAAAAKAAYEAALQAKSISEGAIGLSKQGNELECSRSMQDGEASRTWQGQEGCNLIMEGAKMASKKRLEAASAAIVRAQNFEAIVKAAELAATAITQIGSVVAMGESVPFNLETLTEVGPEGFHRLLSPLLSAEREKNKGGVQNSGKKGTPKQKFLEVKDKKSAKKSNSTKKSLEVDKGVVGRKDMAMVVQTEPGAGLLMEFNKQKGYSESLEGLQSSALDMIQQEGPSSDNQIVKDSHVEVMSDEKGLRGVWFSATVQNVEGGKVLVLYDDLLSDDGISPLKEWIQFKGSPSKAPRIRLAHPNKTIGFKDTRKRRREALDSHNLSVGDQVDAWMRDGWWEGEIREIIEDGESKAKVFFPGDGDTSLVNLSKLRPSLVWKDGKWVLWTAGAKEGKSEPKLRADSHESETPTAKRQKTEKHQASSTSKQKIMGVGTAATGTNVKDNNVSDNALMKLSKEMKSFTVDGPDKTKQQGSKVVFGVPKPTKKRKLIEVSKHFSTGRGGARTMDPLNGKATSTGQGEDAGTGTLGFAMGSTEAKKLDSSKIKKRVAFGQKTKSQKDADPETVSIKNSGVRTRKDKPAPPTKALGWKDTPIKGAGPALSKNSQGKVVKKKVAPSDVGQPEPQEQPGQLVPTGDAVSQGVPTGSENTAPVVVEEGGTEPLNTDFARDHANPATESKQTSHPSRKVAAQASGSVKESKKYVHSSKESQKQNLNESKESQSNSVKASDNQPADSEVLKEKQPSSSPKENNDKQGRPSSKHTDKGKDARKPGLEGWEPRRTSRKIQPTSKLLEGLQTAPKLGKSSSSHDRGSRAASKAPS